MRRPHGQPGERATKIRRLVIGGALVVIGVPLLLVLIAVASFYALFYFPNRTSAVRKTLVSSGRTRDYLLYVPKSYDRTKAAPLVISLHPAMSWPAAEMSISGWNRVADRHGFIVAYPAGSGGGPKVWLMEGRRTPSRMPDVMFISALIDTLEASYNIDPARIYADGMSNGGGMAFVLSCALPERIAAVGMVAAARSPGWSFCPDHRPLPAIAFHGTADPLVPYAGGHTPIGPQVFPSVAKFTSSWAERNRCEPTPTASTVAADVNRLEYTGCADGASVVLFTIEGGGHQWPGGRALPELIAGRYSSSVDATSEMWDFFRAHPRPGANHQGGR